MLRQPLLTNPDKCSQCELAHPGCELCRTNECHCMKYHVPIVAGTPPCTWRETATAKAIASSLSLANDQLRQYFNFRHSDRQRRALRCGVGKKTRHVRGLTRRLTITPDMFGG